MCVTGSIYVVTIGLLHQLLAERLLPVRARLADGRRVRDDRASALRHPTWASPRIAIINAQWAVASAASRGSTRWAMCPPTGRRRLGLDRPLPWAPSPRPRNQIQLYKTTFTVASLNDVAGFVLSLRYMYGVRGVHERRGGVPQRRDGRPDRTLLHRDEQLQRNMLYRQISLPREDDGHRRSARCELHPAGLQHHRRRHRGADSRVRRTPCSTAPCV